MNIVGEPRILVIEDNDVDAENARRLLANEFDLVRVSSLTEGIETTTAQRFDCTLLDLGLPESTGPETLQRFLEVRPDCPVVVLTGIDDRKLGNQLIQMGAHDYLPKSRIDRYSLVRAVHYAIERSRTTRQIRETAERWESVLESVPETVIIVDDQTTVLWLNRPPRGDADLVGEPIDMVFPGSGLGEFVRRRVAGEGVRGLDLRIGGEYYACQVAPVDRTGQDEPRREHVLTIRDVTQEKTLEEELQRTERLNAMGRLAGGVAHDFNNLLTVILNVTDMVLRSEEMSQEARQDLEDVVHSGQRAAALVQQLLTFAKKGRTAPRTVELNELLMSMDSMVRRTLVGRGIELQVFTDEDDLPVFIDPSQFEQVVLNLIVNARHSIQNSGTITVSVGRSETHKAVLEVTDTGCGIEPEVMEKLFDPFFTTHTEDGTGLGLSTVYGIVSDAGGEIRVDSTPGEGTTFEVYLPLADSSMDGAESEVTPDILDSLGTMRILVIDDQPLLRRAVERILLREGSEVETLPSAEDALQAQDQYDLVVSDVYLPGMSGFELLEQWRAMGRDTPFLLMSGYFSDEKGSIPTGDERMGFLAKPFTSKDMLEALASLISRAV